MKDIIAGGLAAGATTVLICTSAAGEWGRTKFLNWSRLPKRVRRFADSLLACTFCTSWWVSLAMLKNFTLIEWAATVAVANITVLLIHWSLTTVVEEEEE